MNRRLIGVFTFALIVASLTSFAVYKVVIVQMKSPSRAVATNKLIVAARDLQVGELIHDGDVKEVAWGSPIPDHAVKTKQDAVNRGVIATIYEGEPILDGRLAAQGAGAGLASTIPVGMRAVALRVNEVVGLAGFVLPGMRVDVLVAGAAPGAEEGRGGELCRTVLQNIQVLSAGQKIEKNVEGKPESAQVVNLLVTPDQAEILDLASETRVQLVLRNPIDTKEQTTKGASLVTLFGSEMKPPPRIAPVSVAPRPVTPAPVHVEPEPTVEVFSGAKKSEQRIDGPQGR